MSEERVQEDVKITSVSSHPCEDPIEDLTPCQGRPASSFLPGVVIRSEEGSGSGLFLRDQEAVSSLPKRLSVLLVECCVSIRQLAEPADQLERHRRKLDTVRYPRFSGQQRSHHGSSDQSRLPFGRTIDVTTRGPTQPQGNSRASIRSLGDMVTITHEFIKPTGHGATSSAEKVFT